MCRYLKIVATNIRDIDLRLRAVEMKWGTGVLNVFLCNFFCCFTLYWLQTKATAITYNVVTAGNLLT